MVTEVTDVGALRKGNVLVDFYTATCAPCKALNPILEEISQEFKDIKVTKIDVTRNPIMSQMFGIMSVPTLIFMRDNQVKQIVRGLFNKEAITSMIRNFVSE